MSWTLPSFLVLCALMPAAAAAQSARTIWDNVYTDAQAGRGEAAFESNCSTCHGDIRNPVTDTPLRGSYFVDRWREDTLDTFFDYMKTNMPPGRARALGAPGIPESTYVDILAFIMKVNGIPDGAQELTAAAIPGIQFVGRDGPQPLPSGALVLVTGCLTPPVEGSTWFLTRASEPIRTRNSDETTDQELQTSAAMPLGSQVFRLANLDYIGPDFRPDPYSGHKLQVKGFVVRQPNAERINVTSLESIGSSCGG